MFQLTEWQKRRNVPSTHVVDGAKALLDKAGQGRGKPFPPESRKVPFNSRGHEDKLRKLPNIEWK